MFQDPLASHPDWESKFERLLGRCVGRDRGKRLASDFSGSVGADYRDRVAPSAAVRDCLKIESLRSGVDDEIDLQKPRSGESLYHLQFFGRRERPLDELMPLLEHLGLRVRDQVQFALKLEGQPFFIRSFAVEAEGTGTPPLLCRRRLLVEALRALLAGRVSDDTLNASIVSVGLSWDQVDVLRAYRNYSCQLGGAVRRKRVDQSLLHNPEVTRLLFRYFDARFRPAGAPLDVGRRQEELLEPLRMELSKALNGVADVNEDRILRTLFNLIDATLRTNFYRRQVEDERTLAIKIDSLGVIEMPAPRPTYEIYVHATDMEGIHLRGARVARGGIRWSDRRDDLRSEILDLQQTQMIKNSLIVPQGAKGGFVIKKASPGDKRPEEAGQRAYGRFIRALLDLTDNLHDGKPKKDPLCVDYDEPDTYLVVAADKGTAGFSDIANAVAEEYGFWLGDAFASGGSRGFSHKRLGITARGAWECVRWHFRELGRNIDQESVTVVGIGSMDGDVFGNGMLLSQNIRLLGAFSAQHIFLDPQPDPIASFRERQRLFELLGSTWDCYDRRLISSGGGVFSRAAKRIPLSREIRTWLGVRYDAIDGIGLVRLLLTAPVDLLWFGGIGTFVKGSKEGHEQVDRANDSVRVDASELHAKVIAEGANLGLTQQARVEYALGGGRINMDAIDNSAGVDLSDHEVNLKILMTQLSAEGLIARAEDRDGLLAQLTEEVCAAVIAHNRDQALCLSLDEARCRREPELFLILAERFKDMGLLEDGRAGIASRSDVLGRPRRALTRPELTVLLARSKLALKAALVAGRDFLNLEGFHDLYRAYFPTRVRSAFEDHLDLHPLAYEITVSQICNTVIDRAGASFLVWAEGPTPQLLGRAVSLYRLFDRMFDTAELWSMIRASERLTHRLEIELLLSLEDALAELCRWGLARSRRLRLDDGTIARWREDWRLYRESLEQTLPATEQQAIKRRLDALTEHGLPCDVAGSLVWFDRMEEFPYAVELKRRSGYSLGDSLSRYQRIAEWFGWGFIVSSLASHPGDYRQRLAYRAIRDRLLDAFLRLSLSSLGASEDDPERFLDGLRQQGQLARIGWIRNELMGASPSRALDMLVILMADAEAAADDCTDPLKNL